MCLHSISTKHMCEYIQYYLYSFILVYHIICWQLIYFLHLCTREKTALNFPNNSLDYFNRFIVIRNNSVPNYTKTTPRLPAMPT